MYWRVELALVAIGGEVAAVLLPLWQGMDSVTLRYSLALHLLSLAAVLPAALTLARKNTGKLSPGLLLLPGVALLLPLVGVLAIFCILLGQHALARQDRARLFQSLPMPSYQATRERDQYSLRVDALHDQLLSGSTPVPARLRALLAIQHMQPRYASAALRRMLGDEADDVRLLAYGVLDASEKAIAGRIEQASACFRKTSPELSPQTHAAIARELAELHWELVYQNLVQGNVREFCMKQVVHFATLALRQNMEDAGLWLMMGRVRMLAGDRLGAAQDFTSATAQGIPHARVALYLAELAFLNRDYVAVRRLMRHGKGHHPLLLSQQLCSYWTQGGGGMLS